MANVKMENWFVDELYSADYVEVLRRDTWLVKGKTVARYNEGDAVAGGAVVYTLGVKGAIIKDGSGITKQGSTVEGSTEQITMLIDKPMFQSVFVPQAVDTTTKSSMVSGKLDDQAVLISEEQSTDSATIVLNEITTNAVDGVAWDGTNIYDNVVDMKATIKKAGGRPNVMIVSEDTEAVLLKSDRFLRSTDLGDRVVNEGHIGRMAGMDIFVANIGDNNELFMYDSRYLAYGGVLVGAQVKEAPSGFGVNVNSGLMYGIKVLRETAFAKKQTTA